MHVCACVLTQSRLFAIPLTGVRQTPLSMEFSRQERWRGLPFPTPGDLPNPAIELKSLESSALAGGFFTTGPPGKTGIQLLVEELRSLKLQTVWQRHKKKKKKKKKQKQNYDTENKTGGCQRTGGKKEIGEGD